LWVSQHWDLDVGGGCFYDGRSVPAISTGALPKSGCKPADQPIPPKSVAIIPTTSRSVGSLYRMVHGYRIYRANVHKHPGRWSVYDVPQLGVRIAFRGSVQNGVLDTLAPSSRKVALEYAARPVLKSYRTVTENGVTLSIPAGWPETTTDHYCGGLYSPPEVVHVVSSVGAFPCPAPVASLADAFQDGVVLYPSSDYVPSSPLEPPTAVLRHGNTTVTVFDNKGYGGNGLELLVRRSGSKTAHALTLGLGRDGRIAGAVLASLRATR
jgi:hypothetical protein